MGRLTDNPFVESCCDGGACSTKESAQPCGCDAGCIPPWVCQRHRIEQLLIEMKREQEEWDGKAEATPERSYP